MGFGLGSAMSKIDKGKQAPDTPRALEDGYWLCESQDYHLCGAG